jgi:hypothetical protein
MALSQLSPRVACLVVDQRSGLGERVAQPRSILVHALDRFVIAAERARTRERSQVRNPPRPSDCSM